MNLYFIHVTPVVVFNFGTDLAVNLGYYYYILRYVFCSNVYNLFFLKFALSQTIVYSYMNAMKG